MDFVLIDDESISLFLSKQLFKLEGLSDKVIAFDDPEEALEFLKRRISENQLPKVIFLDLNTPKISGWDLLGALETYSEQLKNKCLIYLLTSSLDPTDIARAREHPLVEEFVQKTLKREKIHEIQEELTGSH